MPRMFGKDKSTLPRGVRTAKAEYGVCGTWKGIPNDLWIDGFVHHAFCLVDEEVLHVMLVPKDFREEVFTLMGSSWSWSKHAAYRLAAVAVLEHTRPKIVHHGIVTPRVAEKVLVGIQSEIRITPDGNSYQPENPVPTKRPPAEKTIRL